MSRKRPELLTWHLSKSAAVMVLGQMLVIEEQLDDPVQRWTILKSGLRRVSMVVKARTVPAPATKRTVRRAKDPD